MTQFTPTARDSASEAACGSAAHGVLVRLFPGLAAALGGELAASLNALPIGTGKRSGVKFGDLVGVAFYLLRLNDNILAPGPVYV